VSRDRWNIANPGCAGRSGEDQLTDVREREAIVRNEDSAGDVVNTAFNGVEPQRGMFEK
jgi:hypothetical protein